MRFFVVLGRATTSQSLTGYVSKSHTLRLLDLFDMVLKTNYHLPLTSDCKRLSLIVKLSISISTQLPLASSLLCQEYSLSEIQYSPSESAMAKMTGMFAGVTGQWAIGNIVVDVLARYDTNSTNLLLRGAPKIKSTAINLQNELDSLTGTYVPIPISLTNIVVTGQFDLIKGGLATVVISGSIGKNRVHAVFQKPLKAGKFSGAFAADIGPIRLSDVIRKTTQVDISRVPFFGSLTIPRLGVTVYPPTISPALYYQMSSVRKVSFRTQASLSLKDFKPSQYSVSVVQRFH